MGNKKTLVVVIALAVSSCSRTKYFKSYEDTSLSTTQIRTVANNFTQVLKNKFYPAKTKFWLQQEKSFFSNRKGPFGEILEQELRRNGFGVNSTDKKGGLKLAYIIDPLNDNQYFVRLVIGDNYQVNRIYTKEEKRFFSESPFVIRN